MTEWLLYEKEQKELEEKFTKENNLKEHLQNSETQCEEIESSEWLNNEMTIWLDNENLNHSQNDHKLTCESGKLKTYGFYSIFQHSNKFKF